MATSAVAICNSALIKVGADRITALSDTDRRAVLCNEQYSKCRDLLLIAHPWNFAIARAELAEALPVPINGWDHKFSLTSDVLRVLEVNDDRSIRWAVEDRYLMTDETEVEIKYIKQVTDTTKFSKHFEEVLALLIARDVCYALTQSNSLYDRLDKQYRDELRAARSFDAQESSGLEVETDTWLNARY